MSRPCWVGSLSFGLVHVPVRLHAAVEPKQVRFHQLHAADGARVHQKRVCALDGESVPYEEIVKGFELRPEHYVEVTRGELEAFDPKASRTIELEDFVELKEIDPVFFEATYHLVPEAGAERQYRAARHGDGALGPGGARAAILRHKGHLCLVRPFGRGLALSTLYFAEEMISQDTLAELSVVGQRPSEQEVDMVLRLIESQATDFEPRRYRNTHRERLLAFLERRGRAQAKTAEAAVASSKKPGASQERVEAFRRIEEGIAALRRGGRAALPAEQMAPARGALRFRQQAAREARVRPGQEEASAALPTKDESPSA